MEQFIASMNFFAVILVSLLILFSFIFVLHLIRSGLSYFKERNYYILDEHEEVKYPQLPEFANVLLEMESIYKIKDSLSQREIVIFFLANIQQINGRNILLKRLSNSPIRGIHRYEFSFLLHGHKHFVGIGSSSKEAVLMTVKQLLDCYDKTIVSTKKEKENEKTITKQAAKQVV
jgi:hypothetical protein